MKIGVDLGGSHIAVGLVDDNGNIIQKQENYIKNKKYIEILFEEFVINNIKAMMDTNEIESIGIAVPGTVSDTQIIKAVNLGIENYNVVEILEKELGKKVKIKNDAKCAAIAEQKYGELQEVKNGIFLCIGTGIGSAVIHNGKLLEGKGVPGFEFSHTIIQKDGLLCNCGKRGCFEAYGSLKRFKEKIRYEYDLESISGDVIREFIRKNPEDKKLQNMIEQYIEELSIGISNIINIFEPEKIVFGGSFSDYREIFYEPLKNKIINGNLLFNPRSDIIMEFSKLRNNAGIIGATLI